MELNFKTFGQGPPLVILHGLFGMLDNWQTLGKRFSEDYTVFLVDQRNHGRSPHTPDMNYALMAEDLKHFMEKNWVYQAHILGHSMGGKTAMEFAAHYPDMVDKLVVVDIAPKDYPERHTVIFDTLLGLDLENAGSREAIEEAIGSSIKEWDVVQFLMKSLARQKHGGFRFKMNLPVLYDHYGEILAEVAKDSVYEGASLFIRGGNSNHVLPEDADLIQKKFPNSRLITVEGAGHWVHAEKPDELYQSVAGFLT